MKQLYTRLGRSDVAPRRESKVGMYGHKRKTALSAASQSFFSSAANFLSDSRSKRLSLYRFSNHNANSACG